MAARFVASSTQRLVNAAPAITTYPFTVALWVRPNSAATRVAWDLGHTANPSNTFKLSATSTVWRFTANGGGTESFATCGTVVANQWQFILGRAISATNRRISVLDAAGSITHGNVTASRSPAVNSATIGARQNGGTFGDYWDGLLAEYWITNTDIQPDGLQLQNSTLRQLAYQGPFSLPHIAKDVVEYRSFRSRLDSRADTPDEVYHRGVRQAWTNTNGVTLGQHPPAADNYASPLTEDSPMVLV